MTFRLFHSAKIRNYFLRLHDHFAKQKNRRTYNLSDNPHHSDDGVNPAQVPAWGSQFFPDIRHCVNTDNINTLIGKEKEIVHHFVKYPRIQII